jgi:hypothetical protein
MIPKRGYRFSEDESHHARRDPAIAGRSATEAAVMKPPPNCRGGDCAYKRFSAVVQPHDNHYAAVHQQTSFG